MNYLDRNVLPKFQERLDLAASELNDMEDIFVAAINEIAGRVHIINNLVPAEERSQYAEEENYLILDKITQLTNQMTNLNQEMATLRNEQDDLDKRFETDTQNYIRNTFAQLVEDFKNNQSLEQKQTCKTGKKLDKIIKQD